MTVTSTRRVAPHLLRFGRRGRYKILTLVLALGMVAAACGGDSESTTTAGGGGGEEEFSLLVWASRSYYVPPDQFASYEADHPGVTVEFDIQSNDDMLQQLLRMRDAGQKLPDILGAEDSFLIEAFVDAGLIESHDQIAADWEAEDPDQYALLLPLVWDETTIDGVKYGMSVTANFDVLYYNTDWFAEAGVEPPFESLDEVLDALRALKASRPDSIPLTVQAKAGEGVTTLKTMLAAAGAPFDGAVPDLTSDSGVYVLDWFVQAANEGLLPPEAIAWGEDESRGAFVSGDAGLILDGFTTAGDFNEAPDFDYPDQWNLTTVPTSTGTGLSGVAISSARTWAVLAGSEHPDEAADILRYIAQTDNLVDAVFEGSVPMRQTEAINDSRLTEYWPFFTEELKQVYLDSAPVPAGANAGAVEEILEQLFGEIVVGTDSTGEELAAKYQPLLDEA